MKLRSLAIGVIILGAVTGGLLWLNRSENRADAPREGEDLLGQPLLSAEILEKTEKVELSKPGENEKVVLVKNEAEEWVAPDYYDLQIDFAKLQRLTNNLSDATVLRFVTRNPERIERLDLGEHKIALKDGSDNLLWGLESGKKSKAGTLFFRFERNDNAYLTDLNLYMDTTQEGWVDKKLLKFKESEVRAFTLNFSQEGESALTVKREKAGDTFQGEGLAENESLQEPQIKRLLNALINARFTRVIEPDDPDATEAREEAVDFVIELFNGDTYTLSVGQRPAKEEEITEGEETAPESADAEIGAEEGQEDSLEDVAEESPEKPDPPKPGPVCIFYTCSDTGNKVNTVMTRVVPVFTDYVYQQIPESRGKFIEVKEAQIDEEKTEELPEEK